MRAHALLTTVTAGVLVLAGAGVAHAEGTADADAVALDIAQVAPAVDVQDGGSSVTTLPGDTAGAIELATSNGTLRLGLPGAARRAVGQSAADGTVVYTDAAKSTDVAAQALSDGVRVQTVLQDNAAPSRFTYALPDSVVPILNEDGSVVLLDSADTEDTVPSVVGVIDAPWAKDAAGASVATHYEVSNGDVVQVVEHGDTPVTYPIVADPKITAGITGTPYGPGAYLNLTGAEMKAIAAAATAAGGLSVVAICSGATKLPSPVAKVAAVLCTAGGGVTVKAVFKSIAKIYSNKKYASNSCYQTKVGPGAGGKPFVKTARKNCS
jgi:hypothetical protein